MKAIVTVACDDGSFAEVGMNTRAVMGGRESAIRWAAADYARGKRHRIEFFGSTILEPKPIRVAIIEARSQQCS